MPRTLERSPPESPIPLVLAHQEEARFYLDATAGDVQAAVKAYEADGATKAATTGEVALDATGVQRDAGCLIA